MTAMIAASLAQTEGFTHAIYPSLTGLNPFFPSQRVSSAASLLASSTAR